jgi:hypothetical protein
MVVGGNFHVMATARDTAPSVYWLEVWLDRTGLHRVQRRGLSCLLGIESDYSAVRPVA